MSQQSSSPTPQAGIAAQTARRNDPMQINAAMPSEQDWKKVAPMDSDPAAKEAMQAMFKAHFLEPGVGLGTKTWSPETGIRREQQRRMAQGASARERMRMFTEIGAGDRDKMQEVFNRAYTSPRRAFMLARRG